MFDKLRILSQLEELRKKWLVQPKNRCVYELQARALKMALAKWEEKNGTPLNSNLDLPLDKV